MKPRRRIAVVGTFGNVPFAGMAWMHCQFLVGLARLGHDVLYVETTTAWPFHPTAMTTTSDPTYPLGHVKRVLARFGLGDRWAYRAAYADGAWFGPFRSKVTEYLASADAVLNITGATTLEEIGVPCRLVYIGTDPVLPELRVANGDEVLRRRLAEHVAHFTYGERIGFSDCPVPPLPFRTWPMRQPILLDAWASGLPGRQHFTTVTNWAVTGYDVEYQGARYSWSKNDEFLKVLDLPLRTTARLELALGLSGVTPEVRRLLRDNRWSVVDGYHMSLDPWTYRDYICDSSAEFTVAKSMVVQTKCGWFSERSACYLAAGRPVVSQDTGFSGVLPTGEGLFAFHRLPDVLEAIEAIQADYERQSRAARALAEEFFRAETVLAGLLHHLDL